MTTKTDLTEGQTPRKRLSLNRETVAALDVRTKLRTGFGHGTGVGGCSTTEVHPSIPTRKRCQ